ncbi:hypothetical protein [Glycomyces buryatensis]|uniref:Uncharacterized protein n=1 Tax=Glycomyces buryatensis TaxID=2570927 RepID=A0A4S8QDB8_9ACTN|nr:hypothetical protein [Glycomyces buryatensis]THV38494.1 hypothetical protein FAB82_18800 [Glycomyces buryatensis]
MAMADETEVPRRLRFAAGVLLASCYLAIAVLPVHTIYVATALWNDINEPYIPPPGLIDYLVIGVPLLIEAVLFVLLIRSGLRLWGPLMAGGDLTRRDTRRQSWMCATGLVILLFNTGFVFNNSNLGDGASLWPRSHLAETIASGAFNWVGWLGLVSLIGIVLLFLAAAAIAAATAVKAVPRERVPHLRPVRAD